jgi:hypothetical protein
MVPKPTLPHPTNLVMNQLGVKNIYSLGNIASPILVNFILNNLATPITLSGVVMITKNGVAQPPINLNPMTPKAQKIFDGFKDNPADFDNNTLAEFSYSANDKYGIIVQGRAKFYGKSIIDEEVIVRLQTLTPDQIAKLKNYTKGIVEIRLVNEIIENSNTGRSQLPLDPTMLLKKLRSQSQLYVLIDKASKTAFENPANYKECIRIQSQILKQSEDESEIIFDTTPSQGKILKALDSYCDSEQRKFDNGSVNIFADKILNELNTDPYVINLLNTL